MTESFPSSSHKQQSWDCCLCLLLKWDLVKTNFGFSSHKNISPQIGLMEQTSTMSGEMLPLDSSPPFLRKEQQLVETKAFSRSLPIEGDELDNTTELLEWGKI